MMPERENSTTFYLIRHAMHDLVDRGLAGRSTGIGLSEFGREQATTLARHLATLGITHVEASPQRRAIQTAAPLSALTTIPVTTSDALDEIDFGQWTGGTFEVLSRDPLWQAWNRTRTLVRPPGGESMAEAQTRAVYHLNALHAAHPGKRFALFTHAEIVRAVVLHCLCRALDEWSSIEINPASVTAVTMLDGTLSVDEGLVLEAA